jgi:tRNA threonylcarbamoyl adenosine modification protein YjeE
MTKKKSLAWLDCSEAELRTRILEWALSTSLQSLQNSVIFLEGEMGSGKSTFVRELLSVLAPEAQSMGSPTFPLVTEYRTQSGSAFYHIDLYRLKSASELRDSGIEEQIEEAASVSCIEWASLFPDAFAHWFDPAVARLRARKSVWLIQIENSEQGRNYELTHFTS